MKKILQNSKKNYEKYITWLTCSAQLHLLVNEMKECDSLLTKIKTDRFPNPILF